MSAKPISDVKRTCEVQKLGTHGSAGQTLQPVPVLPLKDLHDDAVVSPLADVPLPLARNLRRQAFELGLALWRQLDRLGLLNDQVEVLVETVEKEGEELLSVVLIAASERGRKATDRLLRTSSSARYGQEEHDQRTLKVIGETKVY